MLPLLALIAGVQCVLLGVTCWILSSRKARENNCSPRQPKQEQLGELDGNRVRELLAAAGQALSGHSEKLERFEESIRQHAAEEQLSESASLADQLRDIRDTNQSVERTIENTIEGLIASCGNLLSEERASLGAYEKKTSAFDDRLAGVNSESSLVSIAGRLLDMVCELRDENKAVRDEVTAGKDKINELLTRASSAEQIARVDPLTQLLNRRAFDEAHIQCYESLCESGQAFCIILLDVDHFKNVNDEFGHAAGDSVLSLIGRVLRENSKTSDYTCRLGGEEFAVLLPRCEQKAARCIAERYRQKLESAVLHLADRKQVSITVSCGVAQARPGETRSRLLERVDAALYEAKTGGRNQTCVGDVVAGERVAADPQVAT